MNSISHRARRAFFSGVTTTALLLMGLPAQSQGAVDRKDAFRDWGVFVDEAAPQKYCWAATVPQETRASRQGIRRGDVYLSVTTFPSENVRNQVSVKLGFPPDPNKSMTLKIGAASFDLFSDGEEVWLESAERNDALIDAMRRGANAEVTTTSQRGTKITDVFSLLGFTNSINRVAELCQ